jgi:hypothetical protein
MALSENRVPHGRPQFLEDDRHFAITISCYNCGYSWMIIIDDVSITVVLSSNNCGIYYYYSSSSYYYYYVQTLPVIMIK